jgi:putative nucleotidyltransferase with HDIG domain
VTPEEKLRRRLSTISNLPTPPMVFNQISRVINDPSTSVKEAAAIMAEDPAMSAKVLRLANSAYFGARAEITHIKQAVLMLGLDAVKSLVLSSSVFDMFKSHKLDPEYQERFWRHSLATALAAKLVTRKLAPLRELDSEVAFSAGLLHDLGKLIICCFMPTDHRAVVDFVRENDCSDYQAEQEMIGFTHALIGRLLAENWKLPARIQAAIAYHHSPDQDGDKSGGYANAIHLANYLAIKTFDPKLLRIDVWSNLQDQTRVELEITEEVEEQLSADLLNEYSRSSTFIQMAMAG